MRMENKKLTFKHTYKDKGQKVRSRIFDCLELFRKINNDTLNMFSLISL